MVLKHNQLLLISSSTLKGLYRVILDVPQLNRTVLVAIDPAPELMKHYGGRPKSTTVHTPRKKPSPVTSAD